MSSLTSKIYSKATSKTRPGPAAGMAQITLCCLHLCHVHCYTVWVCVHCCTVWGVFTAIRAVWVFVHCYTGSLGVCSPLYMQSGCVFTTIQAVWGVFTAIQAVVGGGGGVHCYTGSLGVCSLQYSEWVCSLLYKQSGCGNECCCLLHLSPALMQPWSFVNLAFCFSSYTRGHCRGTACCGPLCSC